MEELIQTIPKNSALQSSQDYELLRTLGIEHIQKLGSKIWTDYNAHDPGITMLELLSYAITDLGYRTGFDIKDLIAPANGDYSVFEQCFHKAANIFPCNQVTVNDLRKILIDIDGIRNAWIRPSKKFEKTYFVDFNNNTLSHTQPGTNIISMPVDKLKGLYDVVIEFDRNVIRKGETSKEYDVWKTAKKEVHKHRNLCEDFYSNGLIVKKPDGCEEIKVFADIDVLPNSDNEAIFAEVLIRMERFFSPSVTYYSMQELFDQGLRSDQVFEGPLLKHGFISDEELKRIQKMEVIHTSDLYNILMDIEGVTAVRNLAVQNFVNPTCDPEFAGPPANTPQKWILELYNDPSNPLDLDLVLKTQTTNDIAEIRFYKGDKDIPVFINSDLVFSKLEVLRLSDKKRRERLQNEVFDLEIPHGNFRDTDDYYPIQNELPLTYGAGEEGLSNNVPAERKAQAKQLKAYLMFFEQLLANYLSQLTHVRELFSWDDQTNKTYFTQLVQGVKDMPDLYVPSFVDEDGNTVNLVIGGNIQQTNLKNTIQKDAESPEVFAERRNRFLNHLIARFNERFTEYSLIMMGLGKEQELIADKAHFLADYDVISHDRGKGFNMKKIQVIADSDDGQDYKTDVWDTTNTTGYEFRVSRFLGIENINRRFLYSGHDFSLESIMTGPSTESFFFTMRIDFNGSEILLTGDTQATENDAFDTFNDMLGDLQNLNYPDNDTTAFGFQIFDSGGIMLLATSQQFDTMLERDNARDFLINTYFDASNVNANGYLQNDGEGLHVIEHILLRPKTNDYNFLSVSTEPTDTMLTTQYESVVIQSGAIDPSYGIVPATNVGMSFYEVPLTGSKVHLYDLVAAEAEILQLKEKLETFGANFGNYVLKSDGGAPADYYFYVVDTSGNQLGKSVKFVTEAARNEALLKLLAFFAKQKNGSLGTCSSTVDPYSYRATVVLPAWTTRAKNYNYRSLAEKIIRLEAPAHVSLDILWIDHDQMRELEICYRKFLIESAKGDPNFPQLAVNPVELVARANCTIDKIKTLQDAFAAIYTLGIQKTEEYFRTDPPNKIGHLFASVTDPALVSIVKAEIIGGDPLPNFFGIQGDTGLNSINTVYGIPGTFNVGDIVLVSSHPTNQGAPNQYYVQGVIPGSWTILIETTNALDSVSCSEITITIEKDSDAVWTINPPKHQNCYAVNDLLASPFDDNADVVEAKLVAPYVLPPGVALNETQGFIPSYDSGIDNSKVGHLIVVNPALLKAAVDNAQGPLTYLLKIRTEDADGGFTVAEVKIHIQFDLSFTVNTSFNGLHIDLYTDADLDPHPNSTDIVQIIDTDGIDSITVLTPSAANPSLAFLNSKGIDLFIEGPLSSHGDPIYAYFRVVNHAVLKTYISTFTIPKIFPVIIKVTDGCGYIQNVQINLTIKPDTEAVAVVVPVQHINSFNTGETVITITDADGGIAQVVPQPSISVLNNAGLSLSYSGGAAYIKIANETVFEQAALGGFFTPTVISGRAAYTYSFNVITTDVSGGTTNLTLTLQMYKDREAVYIFSFPVGTSILAYLNFPSHENNNNNIQKNAPFSDVKIKSTSFLPTEAAVEYATLGAPVLFDSNNPIIANADDADGPIVSAVELVDAVSLAPGSAYYKLGGGTAMVSYPVSSPYNVSLAQWGAMLNPITGTITVGLSSTQLAAAFKQHGVGTHHHRIKTTDIFGGVTIHELEIVISADLPAVYIPEGAYPRTFDKYNPGDVIKYPLDPNGRIVSATVKSGTIPPGTQFDAVSGSLKVMPPVLFAEAAAADSVSFKFGETTGTVGVVDDSMGAKKTAASTTGTVAPATSLVAGTWNFTVKTIDEFGGVTDDIPVSITLLPKTVVGTKKFITETTVLMKEAPVKYAAVLPKKVEVAGGSGAKLSGGIGGKTL